MVPFCPLTLYKPNNHGALLPLSLNCIFPGLLIWAPPIIMTSLVYSLWYVTLLSCVALVQSLTFGFTLLPSLSESHKPFLVYSVATRHSSFIYHVPKGLLVLPAPEVFYSLCEAPGLLIVLCLVFMRHRHDYLIDI